MFSKKKFNRKSKRYSRVSKTSYGPYLKRGYTGYNQFKSKTIGNQITTISSSAQDLYVPLVYTKNFNASFTAGTTALY